MKFFLTKASFALSLTGGVLAGTQPAFAVSIDPSTPIPTQLLSFGPIQGTAFLPMTSAGNTSSESGAPAATADGYGWVNSNISITLSSQRLVAGLGSTGAAYLGLPTVAGCQGGPGMVGEVANGDTVCVNSSFDVWFDVKITNIDTSDAYFFGDSSAPQTLSKIDNHTPSPLQQNSECTADTSKPNLGCLPPSGSAYSGHFQVKLDLGLDINGSGGPDEINFDFVQLPVGEVTNSLLQGAIIIDTFNSTINGSGNVMDSTGDPPFTFNLTGPTTASQGIVYSAVPEPASLSLLGVGLGAMSTFRRRSAKQTG